MFRAASFDKPYGFSGSPRHTLFIFFMLLNYVLKIKITTTCSVLVLKLNSLGRD